MIRALLIAATATLLLGAAKPPVVDYRLGVDAKPGALPLLNVEVRLTGDADGATSLRLPRNLAGPLSVDGGRAEGADVVRHKPRARLKLRYRLYAAASPDGVALLGEQIFAIPAGRSTEAAVFRWRLPRDWRAASSLAPENRARQALTVLDIQRSVLVAGPGLQPAERAGGGGVVRAAILGGDAARAQRLADAAAPVIAARRAYWVEAAGPFLVAMGPFSARAEHSEAIALPAIADSEVRDAVAEAATRAWVPGALGLAPPGGTSWLTEPLAEFVTDRTLARAGLIGPDDLVGRLAAADRANRRGVMLALKWDEEIRRRTAGKADLDDVILRMRDHYRQFPGGQGPDLVTGLVSAAWVVAKIDLRPDIARYADGKTPVPLPEILFDGCLDARVNVSPGFDSGFDHAGSQAAKVVKGVRRRGPAWNSGLRDGMRLDGMDLKAGDMTREIVLTVRPANGRGKARTLRYWPYGDADVQTRSLQLAFGLEGEKLAACGRRIGGL